LVLAAYRSTGLSHVQEVVAYKWGSRKASFL